MKHWLRVCKSSHPKCEEAWAASLPTSGGRRLPTRVLDVGALGSPSIKLCLPSDEDTSGYMALSYCWGTSGNPYITDSTNLHQHLSDAIQLTRLLGIQYIWIDALCIIQDSRSDWISEASKMCSVYAHSLLTICASSSPDTSTGLFLPRSPRHSTSVSLPWPYDPPTATSDAVNLHIMPKHRTSTEEISHSALEKRGWTFQERGPLPPPPAPRRCDTRLHHTLISTSGWEL